MKFSKVVLMAALGMAVAGCSLLMAKSAKADGLSDPTITIGKTSSACTNCDPSDGATDLDPLIITDDSGVTDVDYTGPDTSEFFVEIIPFAGESVTTFESEVFSCILGGGATGCGEVNPCNSAQAGAASECPSPSTPAVEFVFCASTSGNCTEGQGTPVNFINTGDMLTVTTPEASPMVLLLIGLASVAGFGWRRRISRLT